MDNIVWKKRFMVLVTIEVPIDFADETMTLEDAYDSAHDYVTEDLGQIVSDMSGFEVTGSVFAVEPKQS